MTTSKTPKFDPARLVGTLFIVEKGCEAVSTRKGMRGTIKGATFEPGMGYRVTFKVFGTPAHVMWAMSSARLSGDKVSLNTGDPLNRVVLRKLSKPATVTVGAVEGPIYTFKGVAQFP